MLPDPIEKQSGLPTVKKTQIPLLPLYDANHDDLPYNQNSSAGFDPQDQYVGAFTPLDRNFNFEGEKSINPMDTNWGGAIYSRKIVNAITSNKKKKSDKILTAGNINNILKGGVIQYDINLWLNKYNNKSFFKGYNNLKSTFNCNILL